MRSMFPTSQTRLIITTIYFMTNLTTTMKIATPIKLLFSLIVGLLFANVTSAQVENYNFSQSTTAYTAISGGTSMALPVGATTPFKDRVFVNTAGTGTPPITTTGADQGFPIGFNFTYDGTVYTNFAISSNGFITLGSGMTASTVSSGTSIMTNNIISAFGRLLGIAWLTVPTVSASAGSTTLTVENVNGIEVGDKIFFTQTSTTTNYDFGTVTAINTVAKTITLSAATTVAVTTADYIEAVHGDEISYVTTGAAPNRVLTVQWKNVRRDGLISDVKNEEINFQIKLYETSNQIRIVYGNFGLTGTTTPATHPVVGLRGTSLANLNIRTTTTDWSATTAGELFPATSVTTDRCTISTTVKPANGLTYTWSVATRPYIVLTALMPSGSPDSQNQLGSLSTVCERSYKVNGGNLTGNIFITAPANTQISLAPLIGYTNTLTLTPTAGTVNTTVIYVRATATVTAGSEITHTSTSADTKSIAVSSSGTSSGTNPTITLGTVASVTTSATTFSIPYTATTGSPTRYSLTTTSPNPLPNFVERNSTNIFSAGAGTISGIPLPSGLTVGTYNFDLVVRTSTCQSAIVSFTLTIVAGGITTTGTLNAFQTCTGTPSTAQSYSVSATGLTANLVVAAPTGYEVSLTAGSGYASTLSLIPTTGTVASTPIFVRLTSGATGSPAGNITNASTGYTTQNVAVTGAVGTVTPSVTSVLPISGGIDTRIEVQGSNLPLVASAYTINGVAIRRMWYYTTSRVILQVGDNTSTGTLLINNNGCTLNAGTYTLTTCSSPTTASASTGTAFNGQTSINVNWINPTNYNRVDILYRLVGSTEEFTRLNLSNTASLLSTGAKTYQLVGLDNDQNYEVYVQARCNTNMWSNWVLASSSVNSGNAGTDCSRPTITSSNVSALQVALQWTAVPNATGYQVFTTEVDGATPPIPVAGTSQVISVASTSTTIHFSKPATKYRVLVRANCTTNTFGEYNDYLYITTGAATACLPPNTFSAVTYAAGANNLANATLSWSGASGTSGSPAYEVHLMLSDNTTIHSRNTDATSMVWTGLSGNQTYQYRVRTFCANGNASAFSTWQPFTVPNTYSNCGSAVTSLTATNVRSWGAKLDWMPAQTNNAPETNGRSYWVQYWNISSPNTIYTVAKDSSKIQLLVGVHAGLVAGQTYGYRVWYLCNGALQSYFTAPNTFQLASSIATTTPIGITLETIEGANTLEIYPNPAKQSAVISYQSAVNSHQPIELTVVDALGREVYRETSQNQTLQTTLNVSKLASGVYVVKVQNGEQIATKRLVVE
jgi:hypothetical protein